MLQQSKERILTNVYYQYLLLTFNVYYQHTIYDNWDWSRDGQQCGRAFLAPSILTVFSPIISANVNIFAFKRLRYHRTMCV